MIWNNVKENIKGAVKKAPFVFLSLFLILGITTSPLINYLHNNTLTLFFIIASAIVLVVFASIFNRAKIAFLLCWFYCFGLLYPQLNKAETKLVLGNLHSVITLTSEPKETEHSFSFEAITNDSSHALILIYFEKDSSGRMLKCGDIVEVETFCNKPENFTSDFDYVSYLAKKHIYATAYISSEKWIKLRHINSIYSVAYSTRNKALAYLQGKGIKPVNLQLIRALCFGDKSQLPKSLAKQFANVGAMHILAVSGLHVGIIGGFLLLILAPFRKPLFLKIKLCIVIITIWLYAFITGLSPSVQRAAIMFSLFSFSLILKRNTNSYNILAAAAFISIVISPSTIYNVGFQLSYIAVLSILYGGKKLISIVYCRNKILQYVWGIIAISLVVNIGLFPLSAYYFKIIPTYGIPLSIIVIPTALIIIVTIALSFIPVINHVSIWIAETGVTFLYKTISFTNSLPSPTISVDFSLKDIIAYYVVVACCIIYIEIRSLKKEKADLIAIPV